MPITAVIEPPDARRHTRARRLPSVRARLGNSWQDLSWRLKLVTPVRREPQDILPTAAKRPRTARTPAR
jgi:hypothetical protein